MYGLDNASGVNVMPKLAPVSSATPLWFTEGGAGLAASYPGQDWFNMVQAELLGVLSVGGVKPEKGKLTQLADAIKKIVDGADFQPSGSYATTKALNDGLALKLDTKNVVQGAGTSTTQVMSQDASTKEFMKGGRGTRYSLSISELDELIKSSLTPCQIFRYETANTNSAYRFSPTLYLATGDTYATISVEYTSGNVRISAGSVVTQQVTNILYGTANTKVDQNGVVSTGTKTTLVTDNIAQNTGTSTTQVISQKAATDAIPGIAQTWQDLTSVRKAGVEYINTTGKQISVFVCTTPAIASSSVSIYSNGVLCSFNTVEGGTGTTFTRHTTGYANIPAGSKYKVEATSINTWAELRGV
nr:hypothetical protein [Providencia rettgeri]